MNFFPILILVAMLAVFWLFAIRPARARQAKQRELINELSPGQEVMTTAGVFGTIKDIDGDTVHLEIAPGVVIRIVKLAIAESKREGLSEAHEADVQAGIDSEPKATKVESAEPESTESR